MNGDKRRPLYVLLLILFIGIGAVQSKIDPTRMRMKTDDSSKESKELLVQLPGQFIVASFAGFREVVAGALWIRADEFFHEGQYQAIIPLVRLVTWLDPHNIDVYTTGAWHLDYNFVDRNQMSDKRYIPASVALLNEGIKNNPNIYDLYFELGWTHYNKKLYDDEKALKCMEEACKRDSYDVSSGRKLPRPEFVDRMLAHQYEKVGRFDDAINQWHKSRARIVYLIKHPKENTTITDASSLDICDRNLSMLYLRMAWRNGDMNAYRKGLDIVENLAGITSKRAPGVDKWAVEGAMKDYAARVASNNPPGDAKKPVDAGFDVTVEKAAPKVLIIKGKLNLLRASEYNGLASECYTHFVQDNDKAPADKRKDWLDGCRVMWMLTDYDYKMPTLDKFNWKIDTSQTVAWGDLYVSKGQFSDKIDLSVDREFYPFTAAKYKLTVYFTPQQPNCPDFIQDRLGWKGDALTDKRYLDTTTRPGFKMLKWEKVLKAEDIL